MFLFVVIAGSIEYFFNNKLDDREKMKISRIKKKVLYSGYIEDLDHRIYRYNHGVKSDSDSSMALTFGSPVQPILSLK